MTIQQRSLFDDGYPDPITERTLVPRLSRAAPRTQPDRPLSKAQKAFGRLLTKVELLQARLQREVRRLDDALVFQATHLRPRMERVTSLRKDVMRELRPFLADRRLTRGNRVTLRSILTNLVNEVLAHDESPEDDVRELFEELHGVSIDEVANQQIAEARSEMAAMFADLGLDVAVPDLHTDMSEEDVAAAVAELAHQVEREAEQVRSRRQTQRPRTKRQARDEERARRFEETRKASIGTLYRRLAKALHPDLEQDAASREQKSALMQTVTAAYAANDLPTLLRLDLEWVHGGETGAQPSTDDDTLAAYNGILKEQAAEIEQVIAELPYHPRYECLLAEGPFGIPVPVDGPAEVERLDLLIETLSGTLERMARGLAWQEVRGAIQAHRRANRVACRF